jgi:hypothetical protein
MNDLINDICIVVHGLSDHVDKQKIAWRPYLSNLVFSAWEGDEEKYEKCDKVIFNKNPENSGIGNLNRQKISLLSGIDYARSKNYKRVLKWRSDQVPTSSNLFIKSMIMEKFNVFLYHFHNDGYFVDYFMCGSVEDMFNVWNVDGNYPYAHSEVITTKNIIKFCGKKLSFFKDFIDNENNVFSYKWNIDLYSQWKNHYSFLASCEDVDYEISLKILKETNS